MKRDPLTGRNAKVSGVMDMLEQEFHVLTDIEQGKIVGGSGGTGSGGGSYGSGGGLSSIDPQPDMNNFEYKQVWNSAKGAYDCEVSFDDGLTWGHTDVCLDTSTMTPAGSANVYTMDPTTGVGQDWFNTHLGGSSNFHNSLVDVVERDEGGFQYTNYDVPTYAGITQDTFSQYAQQFNLPDNVQGLQSMSIDQINSIYHEKYWDGINADQIGNQKFASELFSLYVNSQGHAIEALQRALNDHYNANLAIDGAMGPNTLQALNAALEDQSSQSPVKDFVNSFNQEMKDEYSGLDGYDQYGTGWDNRVDRYSWDSFYQSSGN